MPSFKVRKVEEIWLWSTYSRVKLGFIIHSVTGKVGGSIKHYYDDGIHMYYVVKMVAFLYLTHL